MSYFKHATATGAPSLLEKPESCSLVWKSCRSCSHSIHLALGNSYCACTKPEIFKPPSRCHPLSLESSNQAFKHVTCHLKLRVKAVTVTETVLSTDDAGLTSLQLALACQRPRKNRCNLGNDYCQCQTSPECWLHSKRPQCNSREQTSCLHCRGLSASKSSIGTIP